MNYSAQLTGSIGARLRDDRLCVGSTAVQVVDSGETKRYEREITDGNLSWAGLLVIEHSLNIIPASVTVWDAIGEELEPDRISYLTTNTILVDLSSFRPILGSLLIIVRG